MDSGGHRFFVHNSALIKETLGNSLDLFLPCEDTARRWPVDQEAGLSPGPEVGQLLDLGLPSLQNWEK